MPTIVTATSKGGANKTTLNTIIASELTHRGATITVIDADPNQHMADWCNMPNSPKGITLIPHANENTILDQIDEAAAATPFVLVDLEGTASLTNSYAISRADLVIIPCPPSADDAKEAIKTIKLIKRQEKMLGKSIPYAVVMSNVRSGIVTKIHKGICEEFLNLGVPLFEEPVFNRAAHVHVKMYGGTIHELTTKDVYRPEMAVQDAQKFVNEIIKMLKG